MPAIKGTNNIRRAIRKKDCKYYVERGLESMGFKVNSFQQEKIEPNECVVTVENCNFAVETTSSYYGEIVLRIMLNVDDNNELPYIVVEIMENITRYVEESNAPWCTTFRFLQPEFTEFGETHRVDFICVYSQEITWVE
jgi:hypothetical protein